MRTILWVFAVRQPSQATRTAANVDIIQLDDAFFAAIGPTLTADEFVSGAKAKALDANDFLLYDTKTGTLSYDADGSGAGKAIKIATSPTNPSSSTTKTS